MHHRAIQPGKYLQALHLCLVPRSIQVPLHGNLPLQVLKRLCLVPSLFTLGHQSQGEFDLKNVQLTFSFMDVRNIDITV